MTAQIINRRKQIFILLPAMAIILSLAVACNSKKEEEKPVEIKPAAVENPETVKPKGEPKPHTRDWEAIGVKGKVQTITESLYYTDSKGKKGALGQRNVFKYEPYGSKTEFQYIDNAGKLVSITRFKYDDNYNMVSEELYMANGVLDTRYAIKTDEEGRKKEQQTFKMDGNSILNYLYKYNYDNEGRMTEWYCLYPNGNLLWKYEYQYDARGNKTEWQVKGGNNQPTQIHRYKHDDNNNMVEENIFNPDGRLVSRFTYTYRFDKAGNWIEKIKYENNQPVEIREREIVYY
jgi:hypothetical protein